MKALGGCMLLTAGASVPYWSMGFAVFAQATPSDVVQIGQQAWNLGPLTFLVFMFLLFLVIFIWLLIRANGEQRAIWLAEKKTSDERYAELVRVSDEKHSTLGKAQNDIAARFTNEVALYRQEAQQTNAKLIELTKETVNTMSKTVATLSNMQTSVEHHGGRIEQMQATVEDLRAEVARLGSTPTKAIAMAKE